MLSRTAAPASRRSLEEGPDMTVEIYHNPRCSKSRAALELLRERGVEPEVIEYLKSPPDALELKSLLDLLGLSPRQLIRSKEPLYRELGLDDTTLDDDALIRAMVENPILIERPIVVTDGKAALGRPPEAVLRSEEHTSELQSIMSTSYAVFCL